MVRTSGERTVVLGARGFSAALLLTPDGAAGCGDGLFAGESEPSG